MWVYSCLLPKASGEKRIGIHIYIAELETVLILLLSQMAIKASLLHLNRIEIVIELLQLAFTTISINVDTSKRVSLRLFP